MDITEEEAVEKARQIMADAGYGNEAIECIVGWDECVYTLLHDPDAAKRYLENSAGNDYAAALHLKMYLTD